MNQASRAERPTRPRGSLRVAVEWIVSPAAFLLVAAAITAGYLAAHLAGWRDAASVLSGTPVGWGGELEVAKGLAYAGLHFGFVLATPILTIAAVVFAVLLPARSHRDDSI